MICTSCRYHYRLDPKLPPYIADRRFAREVARVSDGATRPYTATQLHGSIFRRRNRPFWRRIAPAPGTADLEHTRRAVQTWRRAGGDLGPILHEPALADAGDASAWPEPDVFAYGAEGVLVVDQSLLVDLLVGYGVHTTSKLAIIDGPSGYPQRVVEHLRPLVAARPDLPIFVLHDSSSGRAEELAQWARHRLVTEQNPIIDIGLPEDAARRLPILRFARRIPVVPVDLLPHRWLTDGVAAAVVNRASFVELQGPKPADQDADDDGSARDPVGWLLLGDGDFDF